MKILINRSDAIGDLLLTLPVLKVLKEKYKDCEIGLIISSRTSELISLFPDLIDCHWILNKNDSLTSKINQSYQIIEEFRPSHYFYIGGDTTINYISWLKRVPFRGGLKSKANTFLTLNKGVRQKRSCADFHESHYNLQLLTPLASFHYDDLYVTPHFSLQKELIENYREELKSFGIEESKKWIVIHPGMTGHTLNWPLENYVEFVEKLAEKRSDCHFIISYTPSDQSYLDEFIKHVGDKQLPLTYFDGSKKGLVHYLNILSQASLFIGPSTGTTHLANLLGIKQIALYSPLKVQSAKRWGPLRQDNRVQIMTPMLEYPSSNETELTSEIMNKITVEMVLSQAQNFLSDGVEYESSI